MSKSKKKTQFLAEIKEIDSPDKVIVTQKGSRITTSLRGKFAEEFAASLIDSDGNEK